MGDLIFSSNWVKHKNVLQSSCEYDCLLQHKINAHKQASISTRTINALRSKNSGKAIVRIVEQ